MSNEQKPKTETEIIRGKLGLMREALKHLYARWEFHMRNGASGGPLYSTLLECVDAIDSANEARDKSRNLSVQVAMPDLSESVCRGLLEIGFDTALAAVIPQLKTVKYKNEETKSGMCTWYPPVNPFRRESTTVQECTCAADSGTSDPRQAVTSPRCPVHAIKEPSKRKCGCPMQYPCDCPGTVLP